MRTQAPWAEGGYFVSDNRDRFGWCRRYPPRLPSELRCFQFCNEGDTVSGLDEIDDFPITHTGMWCGEWQAKTTEGVCNLVGHTIAPDATPHLPWSTKLKADPVEPIAVTETEAARLLSLSYKTLGALPSHRTGKFHVGRAVRYHLPTLKKFAADQLGGAIDPKGNADDAIGSGSETPAPPPPERDNGMGVDAAG